ncbi:MAG: hypothetical protein ISS18_15395 [Bacteroidales bacterium]|nr:hypothetical protein [Bacteroidales bacterium]
MKKNVYKFILLFSLIICNSGLYSQNYRLINLNKEPVEMPDKNFFILDVLDNRQMKSAIGIVKSDETGGNVMLDFTTKMPEELMSFFKSAFPPDSGQIPIIISVNKLWVTELEKDNSEISKCEITLKFLTPDHQDLYISEVVNKIGLSSIQTTNKENIRKSIIRCMDDFNDSEWQINYFKSLKNNYNRNLEQQRQDTIKNLKTQRYYPDSGEIIQNIFPKFRFALQGGYSYRLAKILSGVDKEFEDYIRGLKSGYNIGGDFNYFINEKNSLGVNISFSQAKNTMSGVALFDSYGNIIAVGDMKDDIRLFYIGPSYTMRSSSNEGKSYILGSFTLGYLSYKDNAYVVNTEIDLDFDTIL